ncbi:MAG TPA: acyltransferase [Coriobacteriia bacterium]|nr:acyltransferase [Coriobacteriia bacterium]
MKSRIPGFDWLRVVAAFAIVAFHITPYKGIANELAFSWAVPFFFALSGYLNGASRTYSEPGWLRARLLRLAVPYAIWTTLRLVDLRPLTPVNLLKQYLLCAPTSTLWFLWTLMLCVGAVWLARRVASTRTVAIASVAIGIAYVGLLEWWQIFGGTGAWLHANPGYALQAPMLWLWVYALGMLAAERPSPQPALGLAALAAGVALMVGWRVDPALGYNFSWGVQGIAHGLLGLGTVLMARWAPLPENRVVATLATASLGVYLIHPAFIRVVHIAAGRIPVLGWVSTHAFVMWALVSVVSVALAVVLERGKITRWIVA